MANPYCCRSSRPIRPCWSHTSVLVSSTTQAAGDPFLGWTKGSRKMPHDFYVRQLKDMKGSIDVTLLDKEGLTGYGQVCGAVLARAHARSGDASLITGYLGETDEFDDAVAEFALAYSAINAADHGELVSNIMGT
jgi:hypothetical protein